MRVIQGIPESSLLLEVLFLSLGYNCGREKRRRRRRLLVTGTCLSYCNEILVLLSIDRHSKTNIYRLRTFVSTSFLTNDALFIG
jgi:hypothetical protein